MRRLFLFAAWLLAVPATAQVVTSPVPYVNGAGVARGSVTFPVGSAIQIDIATPAAPTGTPDNGSGSLAAGVYQITVVAVDPAGGLSLYPAAIAVTTAGGSSHIDVAYARPAGAISMRVYVSAAGGATPDRYFSTTHPSAYALTTLAGATVAALPTASTAYRTSTGGSTAWFGALTGVYASGVRIHSYAAPTAVGANTFVGANAGNFTMGPAGGASDRASYNTALGYSALEVNTIGWMNTAVGYKALAKNTTGDNNTAVGTQALGGNIDGTYNLAAGIEAMVTATSGDHNTGLGAYDVLYSLTTGQSNTSVGSRSGYSITDGAWNAIVGNEAMYYGTGSFNTVVGAQAGVGGTGSTGSRSVFLGYQAGYYETGDDKLFIDNAKRASEADGRLKALIYGVFASATNGQQITINGALNLGGARTITANTQPILNLAETWNEGTTAFSGIKYVITNTASTAASLPFQILSGATNLFSVNIAGTGTFAGDVANAGNYISGANGNWGPSANGAWRVRTNAGTSGISIGVGPDTGNTERGSSKWANGLVTIDMATAAGTGTGTITSPTTAIPANSLVLGMTCKVTTVLAGAGLTTFSIGDGTDADRWGAAIAKDAGTTINFGTATVTTPQAYSAATSIVLTAAAGVFSTGVLSCSPVIFSGSPIGS